MTANPASCSSQRQFRERLRARLARNTHQIVFALDGIPGHLVETLWNTPVIERWRAVFPTTSTTGWLSSLTGLSVKAHGIPGVVFRASNQPDSLINLCQYQGEALDIPTENIFHDARRSGYLSQAVIGDLLPIEGAWTRALLDGAAILDRTAFFTAPPQSVQARLDALDAAIERALQRAATPTVVWVFIDVDQYIHTHGYDAHVLAFLRGVETRAVALAQRGIDAIAHSDHGLVPVIHDAQIAHHIARLCHTFDATMGGAGLTRWFYVPAPHLTAFQRALTACLGEVADVIPAAELDDVPARAGDLFLIARGERFIAPPHYRYEHGARQPDELDVFYAVWEAPC
ncbi:alkaline phosphatase family protein [Pantoea sp. Mb-10]|uniref:alkaline phosphatase family protein n=1 Tax=unclassified Pantoea TaxID=2630326 RepID=UPI001E621941|nr:MULTISPECIES: alkaline phosphatase family protein [unclassified Pantoea]MCE0489986.1 alkaline phosphatase family protein [Pantoea sp. Mb-10]MCE0500907.1 alkaline phosphatase family protein [Pantoea sp. Pb-8]